MHKKDFELLVYRNVCVLSAKVLEYSQSVRECMFEAHTIL